MPTVFKLKGFRFFFYSSDRHEPIHIHVEKDDSYCKFWLDPVKIERNIGFRSHELAAIRKIIFSRADIIEERWNEFFAR